MFKEEILFQKAQTNIWPPKLTLIFENAQFLMALIQKFLQYKRNPLNLLVGIRFLFIFTQYRESLYNGIFGPRTNLHYSNPCYSRAVVIIDLKIALFKNYLHVIQGIDNIWKTAIFKTALFKTSLFKDSLYTKKFHNCYHTNAHDLSAVDICEQQTTL